MAKPARVCNKQGCVEIVIGDTYCAEHKQKAWANSTRASQKPKGWQQLRLRILKRDNHTCVYCGAPATEVDHVTPVSRGGSHSPSNLVAACTPCNQRKNIEQRNRPAPGGDT